VGAIKVDLEQIVQHILTARRDLTREDVLKKIYDKKSSGQDYFLDEVAARIVASELGIEIPDTQETFQPHIQIGRLVSGLNDVDVIARVIATYPTQTFKRSDLTEGKVARAQLADRTGKLKLVLWDSNTDLIETGKIQTGTIIRVLHGYLREGFDGQLELHIGRRGEVQISPPDADEADYPTADQLVDHIGGLTTKNRTARVFGTVLEVYPISEFKRKDGSAGRVRRLRLRDATGDIQAVFWNEKVDELGDIQEDDQLHILDARVKTQLNGRIELHVQNTVQIKKTESSNAAPMEPIVHKIADVKEGGVYTIEASVASPPDSREVTTGQGERILMTSIDLTDETGKITMTFWRKHAETTRELPAGTHVRIRNAYAKRGFADPLELTSRTLTTVEVVSKPEAVSALNKVE
jgi:ssDNA-binding replication factor A large subunit